MEAARDTVGGAPARLGTVVQEHDLAALAELLERRAVALAAVCLPVGDDPASLRSAAEAAPAVADLVRGALVDLDRLRHSVTAPDPSAAADASLEELGMLIAREVAAHEIADVAAAMAGPLRLTLATLEAALERGDALRTVAEADSALTQLRRGYRELACRLAELVDREPPPIPDDETARAVRLRREQAALRRALVDPGPPADGAALAARLVRAEGMLSALLGEEGPDLRIDDRVQARELVARIRAWREGRPGDREVAGRRLLEDVCGFVKLLGGVNHRQELQSHDRRLAREALRELQRLPLSEPPPRRLLERLADLEGRDADLDRLLSAHPPPDGRAWLLPLQRLVLRLEAPDGRGPE